MHHFACSFSEGINTMYHLDFSRIKNRKATLQLKSFAPLIPTSKKDLIEKLFENIKVF